MIALGDVLQVRSSLVNPTEDRFKNHPHIAPDTIERETGRLLPYTAVGESGVQSGKYKFEAGDVLYSKIRPNLNKTALVDFGGLCSADMYALQVDPKQMTAPFLHHLLRSPEFVSYATNLSSRANIPKMNRDQLLRFQLKLPSLDEQRRIAAVLDHADDLRTKQRSVIAKLDHLTRGIFEAVFSRGPSHPRWPTVRLGEVVLTIDSGSSPVCESRKALEGEWGVLKLGAISYGVFKPAENKAFLGDPASIRKVEVQPGDLLFSRKNTKELVGATAVAYGTPPLLLLPDLIFRLNLDRDRVDPEYLHALLRSPRTRPAVVALASGSASSMSNISKGRLVELPIELPPIELQHEYSERVRMVNALRDQASRVLAELDDLFTSLQSRAFSGQL